MGGVHGWLIKSGQMVLPECEAALSADPAPWVLTAFALLIIAGMLMSSVMVLLERLNLCLSHS
jgi:hypothetical protein